MRLKDKPSNHEITRKKAVIKEYDERSESVTKGQKKMRSVGVK